MRALVNAFLWRRQSAPESGKAGCRGQRSCRGVWECPQVLFHPRWERSGQRGMLSKTWQRIKTAVHIERGRLTSSVEVLQRTQP